MLSSFCWNCHGLLPLHHDHLVHKEKTAGHHHPFWYGYYWYHLNSFSNLDCALHFVSYIDCRRQYHFKYQKTCIVINNLHSYLFESFIWNFEFMFSHFVPKEATMVLGRIRFKSEESFMDCKNSHYRYALLSPYILVWTNLLITTFELYFPSFHCACRY